MTAKVVVQVLSCDHVRANASPRLKGNLHQISLPKGGDGALKTRILLLHFQPFQILSEKISSPFSQERLGKVKLLSPKRPLHTVTFWGFLRAKRTYAY